MAASTCGERQAQARQVQAAGQPRGVKATSVRQIFAEETKPDERRATHQVAERHG